MDQRSSIRSLLSTHSGKRSITVLDERRLAVDERRLAVDERRLAVCGSFSAPGPPRR
jgi:hypothetical protein